MKNLKIVSLIILFLVFGCSTDNPKTENPLLKNKKISWSGSGADYFEFLPDGSFIACGGDFPLEGYLMGEWENMGENGDFKVMEKNSEAGAYFLASVETTIAKGSNLLLKHYTETGEVKDVRDDRGSEVTTYDEITKPHENSAVSSRATVKVTRFKDDVFILELKVEDPGGKIKKVSTKGDAITIEVMVTNGKRWTNNPPIMLSQQWDGSKAVRSEMTILYQDGRKETATFQTNGYVDNSEKVYEDAWF